MSQIPPIAAGPLEQIARELGETASGSQITRLLAQAKLREAGGESTKWKRLFYSIDRHQSRTGTGQAVVAVLHAIMAPGRWVGKGELYEAHRSALNVSLALEGLALRKDGRVRKLPKRATTLEEAEARANALGAELQRRKVHPDVLRFCRAQLLQENYFHAVLEACKSVADKVRARTGLTGDGAALFDQAFSLKDGDPPLAFNRLDDVWEESEHRGLATLIKGVNSTYRNPTAHAPAVRWAQERSEAVDMLTLVSMLHRRLDEAEVRPSAPAHHSNRH